ncbi:TetR/AcrR family transcriptional regulator [Nocardia inohanensis]|uniref:TetR/AcrR family transcriptional regulator n=1 Tax=Nocardia inohanensis TaxID=209246 RepID=UPI001C3F9C74|nr:TetR/AcrR family transcriptional regulator [Nocardia inohanensis]
MVIANCLPLRCPVYCYETDSLDNSVTETFSLDKAVSWVTGKGQAVKAAGGESNTERAHTGRKRNEAAHQAILDAARQLLAESEGAPITIDTIARTAGVGKQTVYRWWPSKGAVLLDALTDLATEEVPTPDTGSLRGDLLGIIGSTFAGAQHKTTASTLRTLVREAAADPQLADLVKTFTAQRRDAVRGILIRGQERGELSGDTDLALIIDQFYGLFWYRFLLANEPLDRETAERLTDALLK